MITLLGQQLSGDGFSSALIFIIVDSLVLALVATACVARIVDCAKHTTIASLCILAILMFSVLMATIGYNMIDSWNSTFYTVHIAVMSIAVAFFTEAIVKIAIQQRQAIEPNASSNIS